MLWDTRARTRAALLDAVKLTSHNPGHAPALGLSWRHPQPWPPSVPWTRWHSALLGWSPATPRPAARHAGANTHSSLRVSWLLASTLSCAARRSYGSQLKISLVHVTSMPGSCLQHHTCINISSHASHMGAAVAALPLPGWQRHVYLADSGQLPSTAWPTTPPTSQLTKLSTAVDSCQQMTLPTSCSPGWPRCPPAFWLRGCPGGLWSALQTPGLAPSEA